jgi:SAM-dependent methyltransferase
MSQTSYSHEYLAYADGNITDDLFRFKKMQRPWDYNDFATWQALEAQITQQSPKRVLSIGCGPGTWEFRIAQTFPDLEVVGFDITETQIERAQQLLMEHFADLGDRVRFYQGDACAIDPELGYFDLSICLHDVLNHIIDPETAIREIDRVSQTNITTIHTIGGPRTFYTVDPREVKKWRKKGDWLHFTTHDGTEYTFHDHLFDYNEITGLFSVQRRIIDAYGIDVGVSTNLQEKLTPETDLDSLLETLQAEEDKIKRQPPHANTAEHILILSEKR